MKVFCDIDGVLTDFPAAFNRRYGLTIRREDFNETDFPKIMGQSPQEIDAGLDHEFWMDLPWMPYGRRFLELLESLFGAERICLLSFPSYCPDGARGKIAWVRRELPGYEMRLILAMDKRFCASSDAILFDDKPRNVAEFREAGGQAILVPAPWNHRIYSQRAMADFEKYIEVLFAKTIENHKSETIRSSL